jgi:hypothetical protein
MTSRSVRRASAPTCCRWRVVVTLGYQSVARIGQPQPSHQAAGSPGHGLPNLSIIGMRPTGDARPRTPTAPAGPGS